jgi:dihydroorotase
MKTLIHNGHIIDPANNIDHISDLCIEDDRIISIGPQPEGFVPDASIDANGQWVLPGLVDLGAHLREPGQEHKGTIASETRAAASAGITHIACLPDTDPVIDSPAEVDFILQQAEDAGYCHVEIIGALTRNLDGKALSEMAALHEAGCLGVGQGMRPLTNYGVLRQAMEYAASQGLTVFLQPQDQNLASNGCAHEGAIASRLGLTPIPHAAETAALGALLALVEQTGARTHFCRLSTARGVDMIRRAKAEGLPVSADTSAHQVFLTEMDISDFNSLCHVLPPLRSERDMLALREGLSDGTLQVLCSDHQPHEADAKLAPFPSTDPGISGLETLLPLALKLCEEGILSHSQAIACMSCGPAEILGIEAGSLTPGTLADICILEPDHSWELNTSAMLSKGKNSPFGGWPFTGRVVRTLLAGQTVYAKTE